MATIKQMQTILDAKNVLYPRSANKTRLAALLSANMHKMSVYMHCETVTPDGNWNTAKNWLPKIDVDQANMRIDVTYYETRGYQKKAAVDTVDIDWDMSTDGDAVYIRGEVECRNWQNYKCSGSQKFCFAIFIGDSGHIYVHRAPATKGWMSGNPNDIRKRLRKLGIGSDIDVIQQGDFLLKLANSKAEPDENFRHETMGAGHHSFECPVLYCYGEKSGSRQYKIIEPTRLIHTATYGIKHPDIIVQPGVYIVGTTANSLQHNNMRD